MDYLYLALSVVFCSPPAILGGIYNKKSKNNKSATSLYSLLVISIAALCWGILFAVKNSFNSFVLVYSLCFSIAYLSAQIGLINALKNGPVSLTSLFYNFSLIITVVWGFLFWNSELSIKVLVGLILVVLSIFFCVYAPDSRNTVKISLKWIICIFLAVFGNAGCSIVQRTQQTKYHGEYGESMMFFAMLFSSVLCLLFYLKSKPSNTKTIVLKYGIFPALTAVSNVILNMFIMILANSKLPPELIYPVICVGGLSISIIISVIVFKERLSKRQFCGIAFGVMAMLLLN